MHILEDVLMHMHAPSYTFDKTPSQPPCERASDHFENSHCGAAPRASNYVLLTASSSMPPWPPHLDHSPSLPCSVHSEVGGCAAGWKGRVWSAQQRPCHLHPGRPKGIETFSSHGSLVVTV